MSMNASMNSVLQDVDCRGIHHVSTFPFYELPFPCLLGTLWDSLASQTTEFLLDELLHHTKRFFVILPSSSNCNKVLLKLGAQT